MNILETIAAHKLKEVADRKQLRQFVNWRTAISFP